VDDKSTHLFLQMLKDKFQMALSLRQERRNQCVIEKKCIFFSIDSSDFSTGWTSTTRLVVQVAWDGTSPLQGSSAVVVEVVVERA